MFDLYWIREDKQGDIKCGSYSTRAEAEAAIPAMKAELLAQCGEDHERQEIEDGSWDVSESEKN